MLGCQHVATLLVCVAAVMGWNGCDVLLMVIVSGTNGCWTTIVDVLLGLLQGC